uniref:Uncharacterized protein n=1 Tax=Arundo donax TaxID=35708 RepID=A0A0A9DXB5_ARUDO
MSTPPKVKLLQAWAELCNRSKRMISDSRARSNIHAPQVLQASSISHHPEPPLANGSKTSKSKVSDSLPIVPNHSKGSIGDVQSLEPDLGQ